MQKHLSCLNKLLFLLLTLILLASACGASPAEESRSAATLPFIGYSFPASTVPDTSSTSAEKTTLSPATTESPEHFSTEVHTESWQTSAAEESSATHLPETAPAQPSSQHVVYLTFDDGPSVYTERLLDILSEYNVKATFFVTEKDPDYTYLIEREARDGHTVALHSATHNYELIYNSEEAFFKDLFRIKDVVVEQTGNNPWLIRFPGGSSNTVSRHYCEGLMTRLSEEVTHYGYRYTDWNVDSGDAQSTVRDVIYWNVVNGIYESDDYSVVLMHDTKGATVEAIESIIQWCIDRNYTLLPITRDAPDVHQPIAN